jgi:hypothetical protein
MIKGDVRNANRAANKKRTARAKRVVLVGLLVLLVLPAAAEQKSRFVVGVYGGGAIGLGYGFRRNNSGSYSDDYSINGHLGAYVQYDVSELFALQLNTNLQGLSYHWTFSHYGMPSKEGSDWNLGVSFSLNGVLTYARSKNVRLFLLGGAGIFSGKLETGNSFMDFSAGTGIKIDMRPGSRSAINLAGTFHHLPQPAGAFRHATHVNFLRFQVGYEFPLK